VEAARVEQAPAPIREAGPPATPALKKPARGADTDRVPKGGTRMSTDYRKLAPVIAATKRRLGLS